MDDDLVMILAAVAVVGAVVVKKRGLPYRTGTASQQTTLTNLDDQLGMLQSDINAVVKQIEQTETMLKNERFRIEQNSEQMAKDIACGKWYQWLTGCGWSKTQTQILREADADFAKEWQRLIPPLQAKRDDLQRQYDNLFIFASAKTN